MNTHPDTGARDLLAVLTTKKALDEASRGEGQANKVRIAATQEILRRAATLCAEYGIEIQEVDDQGTPLWVISFHSPHYYWVSLFFYPDKKYGFFRTFLKGQHQYTAELDTRPDIVWDPVGNTWLGAQTGHRHLDRAGAPPIRTAALEEVVRAIFQTLEEAKAHLEARVKK